MQKERINEIKKGLEKEIYSKIKDIDVEPDKKANTKFTNIDDNYMSTDFLADILPKKEEKITDTVQILEKNSVNLELDHEEIYKSYDDYLYEPEKNSNLEKEETNILDKELDEMQKIKEKGEETSKVFKSKSFHFEEEGPSIPKFQTEEHLKMIEEDLKNVELRYLEENQEELKKINEARILKENYNQNNKIEEVDLSDSLKNEQNSPVEYDEMEKVDEQETTIVSSNINSLGKVHIELSNDFVEDDEMILPDISEQPKNSLIEDSQFIFEQDMDDEEGYEYINTREEEIDNMENNTDIQENEEYVQTKNPLQNDTEDLDFWNEEDEEPQRSKYVDIVLIAIILILLLVVLKMVNII